MRPPCLPRRQQRVPVAVLEENVPRLRCSERAIPLRDERCHVDDVALLHGIPRVREAINASSLDSFAIRERVKILHASHVCTHTTTHIVRYEYVIRTYPAKSRRLNAMKRERHGKKERRVHMCMRDTERHNARVTGIDHTFRIQSP